MSKDGIQPDSNRESIGFPDCETVIPRRAAVDIVSGVNRLIFSIMTVHYRA